MIVELIFVVLFWITWEIICIKSYGGIISNDYLLYIQNRIPYLELNPKDETIMNNYSQLIRGKFIGVTLFSLISKYYIEDIGIILRGTKMHYLIAKRHKELLKYKL